MRRLLFWTGLLGFTLFGALFLLTFLQPLLIERAARSFVEHRIEQEVGDSRLAEGARRLAERHEVRIAGQTAIRSEISSAISRLQDPACPCRRSMLEMADTIMADDIASLVRANVSLRQIIEGRYQDLVQGLLRDLRIFSASNAVAFLLVAGFAFASAGRERQMLIPAGLLVASVMVAAAIHLFDRNWFFVLLTGNFSGWTYTLWLTLLFALLVDVVAWRARITGKLAHAIGFFPC